MEEIVAIRDMKYRLFYIKSIAFSLDLMFDNKCSFKGKISAMLFKVHPDASICNCKRGKNSSIDYISKANKFMQHEKNDHNFYMFRLHVKRPFFLHYLSHDCIVRKLVEIYDSN